MSKNSPPDRPLPPPPPMPPVPNPPPTPPLIIQLINLDEAVLAQSHIGQTVIINWEQTPISVTTLSGIYIGDVRPEDTPQVQQKQAAHGSIINIGSDPAKCFVEVM